MNVTVAVARVFGTDDQVGDAPRTRPPGAPLVYEDFPAQGESVHVDLGPLPEALVEAERVRRALGRTILGLTFGAEGAGSLPQERVDEVYATIRPEELFGTHNWYASFVLNREFEVDELATEVDFVFPSNFFDLEEEAKLYATPILDVVVSLISTIVDPGIFDQLLLDDRVLLFAEGKRPSGIPVFGGGGKVSLIRGGRAPELLGARLDLLRSVDTDNLQRGAWLGRVAHWHVQALLERDEWKRFLWSFIGLEILTNKLFEARRDPVVSRLRLADERETVMPCQLPLGELIWAPERAPLKSRFATVAVDLLPGSAVDDVETFVLVKDARDRLSHGSIKDAAELPTSAVQDLLARYLTGAIRRFLLGESAEASWEEIVSQRESDAAGGPEEHRRRP